MSRPKLPSSSPKQIGDFPLHMADPLVCSTPTFDTDKPTKLHTDPENNNKTKKAHKQNTSNQCLSRQQEPTLILAVECHRGMPCGEVFPLVCTFAHTQCSEIHTLHSTHTFVQRKGSCFQPALSLCPRAQSQLFYPHRRREEPCISFCHTDTTRETRGETQSRRHRGKRGEAQKQRGK